jgi:hypothetical protein
MTPSRLHALLHAPVRFPTIGRRGAHLWFACAAWPAITIAGAAWALMMMPYYQVSVLDALQAAAVATLLRLPDLVLVGSIVFGLSAFIFNRLGAPARPGGPGTARLALEPLVMFVIVSAGIGLWYPAVFSQFVFIPLGSLPVAGVILLLAAVGIVGVVVTGRRGARLRLACALLAVGVVSPGPLWLRANLESAFGDAPTGILLGIDSLSHSDDLSPLAEWVEEDDGTWYERAVTPGLFTNAVWTSILTQRPVREHGVFHTFQRMQGTDAALLHAARDQGYRTVAIFPDQLTAAVGSTGGFDEDRSGPIGWRQLLLPMVANNSLLIPVFGSALPRPWPGASLSNEAGTFTYDVRRDVRRILRAGQRDQPTFVAAHLTYIHLPAYPGSRELSLDEFVTVMTAPAAAVRDRTIDWQDADRPDDPLPLNQWKIRHVQTVVRQEVVRSNYLVNGGRMVLFSDHGSRKDLAIETFGSDRYHHVPLATFGLPARCPDVAISLIDIGGLMGFGGVSSQPAVEFTFADKENWPALVHSARFRWSGGVDLDPALLAELFTSLRRHTPWPTEPCRPPPR